MKKAIITGITGQDAAYLADLLLGKGYKVYGTYRSSSSSHFWRLEALNIANHPHLHFYEFDLAEYRESLEMIQKIQPDEVYNLASQSFVNSSSDKPLAVAYVTGLGCVHLLDAIRIVNRNIRFFQASSSEIFANTNESPQNEETILAPRNPYGAAKVYAHWMVENYKDTYGMFAVNGILYNHESPLRGLEFVTRKITNAVAKIKLGQLDILQIGNLSAKRDWGYAKEYVEGMHMMMQSPKPQNYILASGKVETVRHFVEMSFLAVGMELSFEGEGINEFAIDRANGKRVLEVNPKFYRSTEAIQLLGDPGKAKRELGWEAKTSIGILCQMMVEEDLQRNST